MRVRTQSTKSTAGFARMWGAAAHRQPGHTPGHAWFSGGLVRDQAVAVSIDGFSQYLKALDGVYRVVDERDGLPVLRHTASGLYLFQSTQHSPLATTAAQKRSQKADSW